MAAPTRKQPESPANDPAHRLALMSEAEKNRVWNMRQRNREYLFSRWDSLTREHFGLWAGVYGDCQIIIGDDYDDVRDRLWPDHVLGSFIRQLGDPSGEVRIPG